MDEQDIERREKAFRRASTCQLQPSMLRGRLSEMSSYLKISDSSSMVLSKSLAPDSNKCLFDPTEHIIDYLPTPIMRKESFSMNMDSDLSKSLGHLGIQDDDDDDDDEYETPTTIGDSFVNLDPEFKSVFRPQDMRMLALVSHNNMKHSMKQFVMANKNVLKKFRVTGTNTTMTMLREVFGDDPDVVYGPSCKSGPLGGDAQLVAMAVTGELGACIFFIDPMDAHPHSADIDCLVRQGNVHNILMMNNPCSAHVCMNTCRVALKTGHMEMIPSFFFNLESPSVEAYKLRQKAVLQSTIQRRLSSIRLGQRNSVKGAGMRGSVGGAAKSVTFGKRKSVIEEIIEETLTEEFLQILEEEDAAMDAFEEEEEAMKALEEVKDKDNMYSEEFLK